LPESFQSEHEQIGPKTEENKVIELNASHIEEKKEGYYN
jgi:hypothetical protein